MGAGGILACRRQTLVNDLCLQGKELQRKSVDCTASKVMRQRLSRFLESLQKQEPGNPIVLKEAKADYVHTWIRNRLP